MKESHLLVTACLLVVGAVFLGFGCARFVPLTAQGPSVVRLAETDQGYQLIRNGRPYLIMGAGAHSRLRELVEAGGNSTRTWGADRIGPLLDEAHGLGLTVTIGIWIGHERHGFDYANPSQVAEQFERAKANVLAYKDHPALLIWAIGNEMEGDGSNPAIWKAINDIARMVKQLDPNHPTMTVIAEAASEKIRNLHEHCPDIDLVGLNTYGGVQSVVARYRDAGGTKPVVITEFGPPGHWEGDHAAWGAPIELTSTEKGDWYRECYQAAVEGNPGFCLGSYAFVWGAKEEATATWYGMFLEDGSRLASVEAMTEVWGGIRPGNRCPAVEPIRVAKTEGLAPGSRVEAALEVSDPDGDDLTVRWILRRESGAYQLGGDAQPRQPEFPEAIAEADGGRVVLKMPDKKQGYRLFAYVYDGHGNAAVANVPLMVEDEVTYPEAEKADLPHVVYGEGEGEQYFVPSGYMGEVDVIGMDPVSAVSPQSGEHCMEVLYDSAGGWGGVVWQSPADDWGDEPGGYDFSEASRLTFWARGKDGGEVVSFGVGLLGRDKKYPDSAQVKIKDVRLTSEWQAYDIPLAAHDMRHIKSGFYWVLGGQGRPVTFYLDEIRFE